MRLKKFLNKLDVLYLKGRKTKKRGLVKVKYELGPERTLSYRIQTNVESQAFGPVTIRTKKQRDKILEKILTTCEQSSQDKKGEILPLGK